MNAAMYYITSIVDNIRAAWAVDREFVDIVCPMGPHGIPLAPHWPPNGFPMSPMGPQWDLMGAQ